MPAKIGTHNGHFHCDEALACAMLRLLPEYKDASITRTRDSAVLDEQDIVVDVGGVYEPERHRYDHHQRGFTETLPGYKTKLSSAGLVYKHFGKKVISALVTVDEDSLDRIYHKVYKYFIEAVDAIDNGISQVPDDVPKAYEITTSLSARVGNFNSNWNEKETPEQQDARFARAMEYVGSEFIDKVTYYAQAWLPARALVVNAMNGRKEVHSSGRIIKFAEVGPWKEHLFDLEEEEGIPGHVLYALYEDSNGAWRVQAVPKELTRFGDRLSLPESWRGVRDDELSKLSGIDGCIFVHAGGFIGGNKTYEGALAMASKSLELQGAGN